MLQLTGLGDANLPATLGGPGERFNYTSVHAAVLVAELEENAELVESLASTDYDLIINCYQHTASDIAAELRNQNVPLGEATSRGSRLLLAFYDRDELKRNYLLDGPESVSSSKRAQLIEQCRQSNQELAVRALRAAIQLKNAWLVQPCNVDRVRAHLAPWNMGIGLHYGRVYLLNRPFGGWRIEGRTVELAHATRATSPLGRYSHIMLSQAIRDVLVHAVVKHTQLRQRVFFHEHQLPDEHPGVRLLNGAVQELKFFHRIGIHVAENVVEQYQAVFHLDPNNIWAYYQLVDYYTYVCNEWNKALDLIKRVRVTHPRDEKVLLDLSKYYFSHDKLAQAKLCAEEALQLNSSFDLAHEHLAVIADKMLDFPAKVAYLRRAVSLSPDSAVNNLNLGLALLEAGEETEGFFFVQEALRIFPDYTEWQVFRESLRTLNKAGRLPELLEDYLEYKEQQT